MTSAQSVGIIFDNIHLYTIYNIIVKILLFFELLDSNRFKFELVTIFAIAKHFNNPTRPRFSNNLRDG